MLKKQMKKLRKSNDFRSFDVAEKEGFEPDTRAVNPLKTLHFYKPLPFPLPFSRFAKNSDMLSLCFRASASASFVYFLSIVVLSAQPPARMVVRLDQPKE